MTTRLEEIFSVLPTCGAFADVGCDHGYIAKAMLDRGKCEFAVISDISKKCLEKAENLLSDYIRQGKALSVVSDGLKGVREVDLCLIAGMGGEEIVSIINSAPFLPKRLVLQPMKNCDKVRVCVVKAGYKVVKDYCFTDGKKYYDLMVLERGKDSLTEEEIEFGRTNLLLRPDAFLMRNREVVRRYDSLANDQKLSLNDRQAFLEKAEKLKNYV